MLLPARIAIAGCIERARYPPVLAYFGLRVGGAATAAVLASAIPGLAEFAVALPTLRLTVMPLGSATALVFALSV